MFGTNTPIYIILKDTFSNLLQRLFFKLFQNNRELQQILRMLALIEAIKSDKYSTEELLVEIKRSLLDWHTRLLHTHGVEGVVNHTLVHPLIDQPIRHLSEPIRRQLDARDRHGISPAGYVILAQTIDRFHAVVRGKIHQIAQTENT